MAALLLLFFAEVVSLILALILVSYDTYVAFCHVRDNSTDFETDGVSEGRSIASPSSSARRVPSRTEFAKLGRVEWPTYQEPGVVLEKQAYIDYIRSRPAAYQVAGSRYQRPPQQPSSSPASPPPPPPPAERQQQQKLLAGGGGGGGCSCCFWLWWWWWTSTVYVAVAVCCCVTGKKTTWYQVPEIITHPYHHHQITSSNNSGRSLLLVVVGVAVVVVAADCGGSGDGHL